MVKNEKNLSLEWLVKHFDEGLHNFYTQNRASFSMFRKGPCLYFHKRTIERLEKLLSQYNSYAKVCGDLEYAELLYATLTAWGMNPVGGRIGKERLEADEVGLQNFEKFRENLNNLDDIILNRLNEHKLGYIENLLKLEELKEPIKHIYDYLTEKRIMKSKKAIVGVSKVLHHLLPDFLMPADGKYILNSLNKLEDKDYRPSATGNFDTFEAYWRCIKVSWYICKKKNLPAITKPTEEYPMNTSTPKMIDNALIGMFPLI